MARPTKTRIIFGSTRWKIDLVNCDDVITGLIDVLQGWKIRRGGARPTGQTATITRTNDDTWQWKANKKYKPRYWDRRPPKDAMRVINDIHDVAIYWHIDENPNDLCLHAASVQIGKGLIVFPALHQAGKSTLMAALSAQGQRVFGDDVLLLRRGRGVALGFLTRLRVPLPETLSKNLRNYINARKALSNEKWISLKPDYPVPFGETKPITAFVLLERKANGRAKLKPVRDLDILKRLIADNFVRIIPLPQVFNRLYRICTKSQKFRLTYSNPDDAARLLIKEFS
jgi:hypothetical protein